MSPRADPQHVLNATPQTRHRTPKTTMRTQRKTRATGRPPGNTRAPGNARASSARAFTIIELLFVISVIGLTLALALPAINALTDQVGTSSALNAINTGITATRAIAVEPKQGARFQSIGPTNAASLDGYSGAAMIITPAGEIRFTRNEPYAQSTGGNFLEFEFTEANNGYADVPNLDPVQLPATAGVFGIIRTNTSEPSLIPPPFGIRFTEDGHLVPSATSLSGANSSRMILYDANGDGSYDRGAQRSTSYNTDDEDPDFSNVSRTSEGYYSFDIEVFESVAGVVVYDEAAFRAAGFDRTASASASTLPTAVLNWLRQDVDGDGKLDNATFIFFNRYSGVVFDEGIR